MKNKVNRRSSAKLLRLTFYFAEAYASGGRSKPLPCNADFNFNLIFKSEKYSRPFYFYPQNRVPTDQPPIDGRVTSYSPADTLSALTVVSGTY